MVFMGAALLFKIFYGALGTTAPKGYPQHSMFLSTYSSLHLKFMMEEEDVY